jgi:hypothetical protein
MDTTTQALNFLRGSGPPGILLYYEELAEKVRKEAEEAEAKKMSVRLGALLRQGSYNHRR